MDNYNYYSEQNQPSSQQNQESYSNNQQESQPSQYQTPQPKPEINITKPVNNNADIDAELEEILSQQKTRIKVVGAGGGGNNTINRISEVGVKGIQTLAIMDSR